LSKNRPDRERASSRLYPTLSTTEDDRAARLGRWDWNVETDELEWTGPIFRIFGITPEEFLGVAECFLKRVHPDDRARVEEEIHLSLEEGKPYSIYHRIVRPNGEQRVVHEQAEVVRDAQGRGVHMKGTVEDITEWRQTREALELLDEAVGTCITPIVTVDSQLKFTFVNAAFVRLMGAEDESELLGKKALPVEQAPGPVYEVVAAARERGFWKGELTITRVDGSPLPVEVNAAVVEVAGRVEEFVVSFIDLTELRRTERELRRREAELTRILSSIDVVVYRGWFRCGEVDAHPGFVSPPIERLVGLTPAELSAKPGIWFDLVHPEDAESLEETIHQARSSGTPAVIQYRIRNQKTGRIHWVEESMRPELDPEGCLVGIFGTLRDVSGQKKSERERAALQGLLRTVALEWTQTFDAIGVPVLLMRWDGTIRRVNAAAAELIEGGFAGAVDRHLSEIHDREPWRSAVELLEEVRADEKALFREVRDAATDATWHVTISPASAADRSALRWLVVIFRDVTELYRLQKTLRRSEKMSAMGALVARVAHEVRNPLFGISATVDALDAEHGHDEHLSEYMVVLRGELKRMGRVMEDLLDYGRPVTLELSSEPVSQVVARGVSACSAGAEAAGIRLRVALPDDLPAVHLDPGKIQQVLQNLIENGIQHSERGGQVIVGGGIDEERKALLLRVEDRGLGFEEGDAERVLEPFYSRRPGGTGLGLWIVERILSEHGGDLRLRNRAEGGAVAEVRLPLEPVRPLR